MAFQRESTALQDVRATVLKRLYVIMMLLGAVVTAAATFEEAASGRWWFVFIYLPAYLVVVVVGFVARKIPFAIRSSIFLIIMFGIGVSELYFFGMSSLAFLFFLALTIFTALLLGRRWGLIALGFALGMTAVFAVLYSIDAIPVTNDVQTVSLELRYWLSTAATFVLLAAMSVVLISTVIGELQKRIADSEEYLNTIRSEAETRRSLEEQLRHTQKMEAVGLLAGGVAHDFNNTIQAVRGFAELALKNHRATFSGREEIEAIIHAADRSAELVGHLLAFSRNDKLDMRELPLRRVVEDSRSIIERIIGSSLLVEIRVGEGNWTVNGDKGALEQVIMNLCLNARDAMPNGGKLTVETESVSIDEEYCKNNPWATAGDFEVLRIIDTGCGIADESKERVFEPFYTTKQPDQGTGLGLSTVYGIVGQHDGFINLMSEPGIGTTFEIYLPRSSTGSAV